MSTKINAIDMYVSKLYKELKEILFPRRLGEYTSMM